MTLISIIAPVRTGKTLSAVMLAVLYRIKNPNNTIFSNFRLNLKKSIYTPYCLIPLSDLENSMLIVDDIHTIRKHFSAFMNIIVNYSGKDSITVVLTGQDYTMIDASVRQQVNIDIIPTIKSLGNNKAILKMLWCKKRQITNPYHLTKRGLHDYDIKKREYEVDFLKIGKLYNTKEHTKRLTENELKKEVLKFSKDIVDLEQNLDMVLNNANKRMKWFNELSLRLNT